MEVIYSKNHQIFPREKEVHFWTGFLSVNEDQLDQFYIPVRPVASVFKTDP
jgi:hypothetical protein